MDSIVKAEAQYEDILWPKQGYNSGDPRRAGHMR
jgi:hypothetical protein